MQQKYLGDSYDLVKRFFAEHLRTCGHLFAHPQFVSAEIRSQYTSLTTIPIFDEKVLPPVRFGLFLDPDTGIPLPTASGRLSRKHASLSLIVELNEAYRPEYIICFDQSFHRTCGLSELKQMQMKMEFLRNHGLHSFYYNSHARFFFIAQCPSVLAGVRSELLSAGIPPHRLIPD